MAQGQSRKGGLEILSDKILSDSPVGTELFKDRTPIFGRLGYSVGLGSLGVSWSKTRVTRVAS
jgi:hypothetical protein